LQFTATIIAARRGGAQNKSVSKNDAIFCNPILWIAKLVSENDVINPKLQFTAQYKELGGELQYLPLAAAGR
jgi:hypothetical protein